jgi:hypothetical protein
MKEQYAKLDVRVTVETLDWAIFLRSVSWDRDWDRLLQASSGAFDLEEAAGLIDTRAGHNTPHHQDV